MNQRSIAASILLSATLSTACGLATAGPEVSPPNDPVEVCGERPGAKAFPYVVYNYFSDARDLSRCFKGSNIVPSPYPEDFPVSANAYDPIEAFTFCQINTDEVITCTASPYSKDVALQYNWQLSGPLTIKGDHSQLTSRTISVTCPPRVGPSSSATATGTLTVTVTGTYAVSSVPATRIVSCK